VVGRLIDYRDFVGDEVINRIFGKVSDIRNKHIVMVNSTSRGGGVAEILRNLVPLMNNTGIRMGWRTLHGHPDFYRVTKRIHNALQGDELELTKKKKKVYEGVNESFSKYTHFDHDLVVIHDPQPLPLIENYRRIQPWIWRCHIDLSHPNREVWNYLKDFVIPFDYEIYQLEEFARTAGDYKIIHPSIDPLSTKNVEIDRTTLKRYMKKIGIDPDDERPLITQVSRFDPWKDPLGVVEVFDKIKEEMDARLLLVGAFAEDDPQAEGIYEKTIQKVQNREDVTVAANVQDIMVNAIQRCSDVILQKSLREGFGLTVTEAMWKGTPVVAGDVGGIPKQVVDGKTGYLVNPSDYDEVSKKTLKILADEERRRKMGERARERVREKFLITRQLEDWLDVFRDQLA